MTRPALLVIAGATATGKTGLAIDVAERLAGEGIPAEVISADSRQVYRGLDIGTAKAPVAARHGVPHHGLDLVDPDEPFTVADFAAHADGADGGDVHGPSAEAVGPRVAGRSRQNKLVHLAGGPELVGRLVTVRIEHAGPYALRGVQTEA